MARIPLEEVIPEPEHFLRHQWDHDGVLKVEHIPLTDLEGRMAHCPQCGRERPSDPNLPFFDYRGGDYDNCGSCHYKFAAHLPGRVQSGHEFVQKPRDTDTYYCGCRGWD